ncbi:MAG TPA: Smr/MutS family protein [Alphaproteobacteria bacterium]|nr:Smr/MutS family protein [Alphaproteobacteria bacterium]
MGTDHADTEDEEALWQSVTKGMEKLPQPPEPPGNNARKAPAKRRAEKALPPEDVVVVPSPTNAPDQKKLPGTDLDRRTEEKLVSGSMPIEGRIDLHGMTQAQAQRALTFFIEESLARGRRTVLVITGKGRGGAAALDTAAEDWFSPKPGALRQNMPRRLEAPGIRPHILKVVEAQPKHGGSGAFYVYLRRSRM